MTSLRESSVIYSEYVRNMRREHSAEVLNKDNPNSSVEVVLLFGDSELTKHSGTNKIRTMIRADTVDFSKTCHVVRSMVDDSNNERGLRDSLEFLLNNYEVEMDITARLHVYGHLVAQKVEVTRIREE
jgi:hypothetical protein